MTTHRRSWVTMSALLLLVLGTSCGAERAAAPTSVEGSGTVAEQARDVTGFTSIVVEGDAVVHLDVGVDDRVVVEADDNLLEHLTTVIHGDRLVLAVEEHVTVSPTERVVYRIGVAELHGVIVAGVADLDARGIGAGALDVAVEGVGDVRLSGTASHLDARIDGAGSIDAGLLTSATAAATIDGTGSVTVAAHDAVDATINGSGSVSFVGEPTVRSEVNGTGTVGQIPAPPAPEPATEWAVIASPALEGNLLGDPAELGVSVWLPATYDISAQRYPAVYFLAGFGETSSTAAIGDALQAHVESGDAPEMILVGVSGANSLGGSFYADSPVTGGWATAVHTDLVTAIDERYRTIDASASRGIAGFSMGGFGALDIAMAHPDVFGAAFAMSPGLLAPGALTTTSMFAEPETIDGFLAMQEAVAAGDTTPTMTADVRFALAYGSAFAPDIEAGPPWVAYPYDDPLGPPDPAVWARWEAGYGGVDDEVTRARDNLRRLLGIGIDYGVNDEYEWIPEGARYTAERLAANGIVTQVTSHDGGHGPVGPRAREVMFPFFADVLRSST